MEGEKYFFPFIFLVALETIGYWIVLEKIGALKRRERKVSGGGRAI